MLNIREELFRQNPWWKDASLVNSDEQLARFSSNPVKWAPEGKELGAPLVVLRGPRQVGKTTLAKRKISALLSSGVAPQSVCFFSCDLVSNKDELYAIVREFLDFSSRFEGRKRWLFIDEASFVEGWPLAVKRLLDSGDLKNTSVFVTGSNSSDLKKGAERLAGRGIEGNEYFLYPLSFGEYLAVFGKAVAPVASSPFAFFEGKNSGEKFFSKLKAIEPYALEQHAFFRKFLQTGGFLKAINELENGSRPEEETYLRWIERDLSAMGKDLRYARQAIGAAIQKQCNPTSMLSIAKQTEIASHSTVKEYFSVLEDLQVLSQYFCFDASKQQFASVKDKKIHFLDPFIAKALAGWTHAELSESCVVEGLVAEHLRRLANQEGFSIGYYKDSKTEVDILLEKNGKVLPIEVKWQEKIAPSDLAGLYKFGHGILATKKTLAIEKQRYLLIPVPMLLSAFKINPLQKLKYS